MQRASKLESKEMQYAFLVSTRIVGKRHWKRSSVGMGRNSKACARRLLSFSAYFRRKEKSLVSRSRISEKKDPFASRNLCLNPFSLRVFRRLRKYFGEENKRSACDLVVDTARSARFEKKKTEILTSLRVLRLEKRSLRGNRRIADDAAGSDENSN